MSSASRAGEGLAGGQLAPSPHDEVTICALTPVAYTRGNDFRPALRPDADEVIHWDAW